MTDLPDAVRSAVPFLCRPHYGEHSGATACRRHVPRTTSRGVGSERFRCGGRFSRCFRIREFRILLPAITHRAFTTRVAPSGLLLRDQSALRRLQSRFRDAQQISRGKFDRLPHANAEFTTRALDQYGLRCHWPDRPAPSASDPVLVHRLVRLFHASSEPCLATTPSPRSGCRGDFHPELSNMLGTRKKARRPQEGNRRGEDLLNVSVDTLFAGGSRRRLAGSGGGALGALFLTVSALGSLLGR